MIIPKGTLIPIGGAEDKGTDLEEGVIKRDRLNFFELGILKSVLNQIGKENPTIILITTASQIPDEVSENYLDAFAKLDCKNVTHLRIRNRDEVDKPEHIAAIEACDGIMISGGNQMRLTTIYGGSEFLTILKNRYQNEHNFVIAGTSAGAMAMSSTMIAEGRAQTAHQKGAVKLAVGWGLVRNLIIDSHFIKRGRFGRLAEAVARFPKLLGVGLAEDTAIIIEDRTNFKVIGSGMVIVFDPKSLSHNNFEILPENMPMTMANLTTHVLANSDRFSILEREVEVLPVDAAFE